MPTLAIAVTEYMSRSMGGLPMAEQFAASYVQFIIDDNYNAYYDRYVEVTARFGVRPSKEQFSVVHQLLETVYLKVLRSLICASDYRTSDVEQDIHRSLLDKAVSAL